MLLEKVILSTESEIPSHELHGKKVEQNQRYWIQDKEIFVLHCEPVLKGDIGPETVIVLVDVEEKGEEWNEQHLGILVPVSIASWDCKDHIAFTSWQFLAQSGWMDGDWIELQLNDIAWVQIHGREQRDHQLYVSSRVHRHIAKTTIHGYATQLDIQSMEEIPVAQKLVLSRISSLDAQQKVVYDSIPGALRDHFSSDRVVMPDFVFDVSVDCANNIFAAAIGVPVDVDIADPRTVFFKVVQVIPHGVCRVNTSTELVDSVVIQDYVPTLEMEKENLDSFTELEKQCISSIHPKALELNLFTSILLHGPSGCGKKSLVERVAACHGLHILHCNCFILLKDTIEKTNVELERWVDLASKCSPCILLLDHFEALSESWTGQSTPDSKGALNQMWKKLQCVFRNTQFPVLLIATTPDIESINKDLISLFSKLIPVSMPAETERKSILQRNLSGVSVSPLVDLKHAARQTAGLSSRDLAHCVSRSGQACISRTKGYVDLI
jgi:thiol-disulfide isomerase/thioredoxin